LTYYIVKDEPAPKRSKPTPTLVDTTLSGQASLDVKGMSVSVKQKDIAGFSTKESLLYVRDETVALWHALNDTSGSSLSIDGPPGTGKSTEVWAWALWKAQQDEVLVSWFHSNSNDMLKVLIDGKKKVITSGFLTNIHSIEDSEGSILIFDGVTARESRTIKRACCNWRRAEGGRRFIVVSSVSTTSACQEKIEANIEEFTVGSWTFEQYQSACDDEAFFEQVKDKLSCPGPEVVEDKQVLLANKFYFAGGCARWMFEFIYDIMMSDLSSHMRRVKDYALCYADGGGDENSDAVNHLRGVTILANNDKKYFFISKYVTVELAMKCDDQRKFLTDSYREAAATENPAFEGWIFEFDVNYQLDKAHRDESRFCSMMRPWTAGGDLIVEERSVDIYEVFNSSKDLSTLIKSLDIGKVLWAKPKLWCQKSYDFLCVWKSDATTLNMVVANATIASTHSILLTEVNKLATELGQNECVVASIRFDFIVPTGAQFTFGGITGQLCEWKNLLGDRWPNKYDAGGGAFRGCLVVTEVARTSK
jgi:hypothetical protein